MRGSLLILEFRSKARLLFPTRRTGCSLGCSRYNRMFSMTTFPPANRHDSRPISIFPHAPQFTRTGLRPTPRVTALGDKRTLTACSVTSTTGFISSEHREHSQIYLAFRLFRPVASPNSMSSRKVVPFPAMRGLQQEELAHRVRIGNHLMDRRLFFLRLDFGTGAVCKICPHQG
jgi:hypothetical protein